MFDDESIEVHDFSEVELSLDSIISELSGGDVSNSSSARFGVGSSSLYSLSVVEDSKSSLNDLISGLKKVEPAVVEVSSFGDFRVKFFDFIENTVHVLIDIVSFVLDVLAFGFEYTQFLVKRFAGFVKGLSFTKIKETITSRKVRDFYVFDNSKVKSWFENNLTFDDLAVRSLRVVKPAAVFGLTILLAFPINTMMASAEELPADPVSSESVIEASPATDPATDPVADPASSPTSDPALETGSEVIVEPTPTDSPSPDATPTVSPSPEATPTDSPSPEASVNCLTTTDPESVPCPSPSPTLAPVINPPTDLGYSTLVEGLKLSWNKSDSEVDKYIVKIDPDGRTVELPADVNQLLLPELDRKATYSFSVWAVQGELTSEVLGPLTVDLSTLKFPRPPMNAEVGGLIVKFENQELTSQELTSIADTTNLEPVTMEVSSEIATDTHLVEFNQPVDVATANEIADSLEASSGVDYAELDYAFVTAADDSLNNIVPNDPLYASKQWPLWGSFGIGIADSPTSLAKAYESSTGLGSVVAVIDTGFTNHPDLDGQFVSGFDFVSNNEMLSGIRETNGTTVPYDGDYIDPGTYGPIGWDDNPLDPGDWNNSRTSSWHGTHIAGLIAAKTNNGIGIAGIAPDAKIQPIRAFSWRGGLLSDVIASITWASGGTVENAPENKTPAKVINLSFSIQAPCTPSLQQAIDDAINRGSVVVAAAGNNNQDASNFAPGNCQNVITVGAINSDGNKAAYSNFGPAVDISAPGGELDGQAIYSTSNEGTTSPTNPAYTVKQGTSIATAQVSAAIAKLAQTYPDNNAIQLRAKVLSKEQTKPFTTGNCATDKNCGLGYLFFGISALPTITTGGVSPSGGTASGGTTVTITGTNFTGATQVTFGGIAGTSFTVVNSTQITVVTPVRLTTNRTVGAVPVVVTNPDGTSNNDVTFTFRPSITFTGNGSLVQLGALASRSQSKSVVRTTSSSPYTTTGTDSRSNDSYSYTSTRDYGNSGAYAYESDDRSSRPGTSITTTRSDSGNSTVQGRTNVITLNSSGGVDGTPVGGSGRNTKDSHLTYGSAFGPEVYSESFYATSSQAISFDWKAEGGGDDYEIYAYLVSLSDLEDVTYTDADQTIVTHGLGTTSDWSTASASIPSNGYYRFRFVNGTFDASGGLAVGANLYIQNAVTVGLSNVISFVNPGDQIGASNATFTFNVSSSSGGAVTLSTSTSSVCSVSTGALSSGQTPVTVTKKTTGTCTLIASQGAVGSYAPAQNVYRSFEIRSAATTPEAPTLTSATGGSGTLTLAFNAGSNGGSAITNYEYSLNNGSTWTAVSPSVTISPISLSGISAGTYSQIKIRAVNTIGSGTASNTRSATVTAPAPNPPTSLSATAGDGQLTIAFTAGSDNGFAISNYKYSLDGTTYTAFSPAVTTSPVVITGLTNGTAYSITLKAVNTNGDSTASSSVTATPAIPAVTVSSGSTSTPTPTPTPTPTNTSTPRPRPTNIISNPLIIPVPTPTPTIVPGTITKPEPLIKRIIEELIEPLKPKIVDLYTSPTPRPTNVSGTNTPAPMFDNQKALELVSTSPDKKVVELPSLVLVNDIPEPSKVVIVDNTTAQIVTPGGGLLNVAANDGQERIPVDNRGRVQMVRNNNVVTEGKGLAPNTEFAVYLFSDPILLGIGKTDNKGQFFATFPVEKELPIGDHTLQVNGLLPDGKTASVSMPVVIVDSIVTAKNQAMPENQLIAVNPLDKALKALYWMLVVLAVMIFLITTANRKRFFALFRRRRDDEEDLQTI